MPGDREVGAAADELLDGARVRPAVWVMLTLLSCPCLSNWAASRVTLVPGPSRVMLPSWNWISERPAASVSTPSPEWTKAPVLAGWRLELWGERGRRGQHYKLRRDRHRGRRLGDQEVEEPGNDQDDHDQRDEAAEAAASTALRRRRRRGPDTGGWLGHGVRGILVPGRGPSIRSRRLALALAGAEVAEWQTRRSQNR